MGDLCGWALVSGLGWVECCFVGLYSIALAGVLGFDFGLLVVGFRVVLGRV